MSAPPLSDAQAAHLARMQMQREQAALFFRKESVVPGEERFIPKEKKHATLLEV